jgi:hypothetical protein
VNFTDTISVRDRLHDRDVSILYKIRRIVQRPYSQPGSNRVKFISYPVSRGIEEDRELVRVGVFRTLRGLKSWGAYSGTGFPIAPFGDVKRIPRWNDITPWMKAQVVCMALALVQPSTLKTRFMSFNHHLNESLLERFKNQQGNQSLGAMVRNEYGRQCRKLFDRNLSFYFVIEEYNRDGTLLVNPHIHGSIEVPTLKLPEKVHGNKRNWFNQYAAKHSFDEAEHRYGKQVLKLMSLRVIGSKFKKPPKGWKRGLREPNFQEPFGSIYQGVSYAFKNTEEHGVDLGAQRFFTSRPFIQDARQLWKHLSGRNG